MNLLSTVVQGDQPDLRPDDPRRDPHSTEGITPQKPETMPRAEDDEDTFERSPEFHDRES